MKDKLVKYHHKAPYYVMRRILIIASCFLLGTAIIGIPLGITIYNRAQTRQIAK